MIKKGRKFKKREEGYQYTPKFTKEVLGEFLKIRQAEGLTPKAILKKAKNPKSPLHNLFEWDNSIAAERYRQFQCGLIINEVQVVIEGKLYSGFENVKVKIEGDGYKRVYEPITEILSKPEQRKQIIENALTYLESWKIKFQVYTELQPIVLKIDEVKEKIYKKWKKKK